jgi:hypothetical protein
MRSSLISAAVLAAALSAVPAAAAPLFSDNFDGEALGLNTTLDNWTVSDGTIDVIGSIPTNSFNFYPGNGNYVDLDGSSRNAGTITTNTVFSFAAGTYTLTFELGGSTRGDTNTVNVTLGGIFAESFTLASGAGLQLVTRTITLNSAMGSGALSFAHDGGDNLGLILDDVTLDYARPDVGVPAPLAASLLLAGLAGSFLRRKARAA